jgi:hypothetical protein
VFLIKNACGLDARISQAELACESLIVASNFEKIT